MRGDGLVVDPGTTHVLKDAESVEINESVQSQLSSEAVLPSVYSQSSLFVDPSYILDISTTFTCTTLYLSLDRMAADGLVADDSRCLLSMLNRSRSKAVLVKHMGRLLVQKRMSLLEVSKVFMRMNGVYKQASIERQSIKKKTPASVQKQALNE